jgi:hypothetical protein
MFQDAFEKLELADVATILDQMNPLFEGVEFDPVDATIMAVNLPFYKGYRLLHIADNTVMPPVQRCAIYSHQNQVVLDFTNEPIYKLNQDVPIQLSEDNVVEYVRFFFTYVRGKHGRFIMTENVDDIAWKEDPPPQARKSISNMIDPISIESVSEDGMFHLIGCMMFKDSLFKSDIEVQPSGLVALKNEELLIEDMPVLDDTFGQ